MVNVRVVKEGQIDVRLKPENGIRVEDHTAYLFDPELHFATYVHEQGIASAVWTVQHNLNKYPSVTVVDSSENEIIAEIEYIDKNNVRITMNGASKGRAYLN